MNTILLFALGGPELLMIFAVILLLFGAKRIPELARGLGRGIREFKDASSEIKREIESAGDDDTNRGGSNGPVRQELTPLESAFLNEES